MLRYQILKQNDQNNIKSYREETTHLDKESKVNLDYLQGGMLLLQ
jgi:hypothetical protein